MYLPAQLANFATRALLYEVSLNPKPGLIDPAGRVHTQSGQALLAQMNADFLKQNLSLGGCADMLI
ncbi:hypothetical protein ACFQ5J_08535 [Lacticaseibacillus baoqingensis]|uniref:Uncharacterized protein n=1 Tax=Lacticaseibacillus baoqingensis TaxID=2486013 RepID=A0ABW4E5V4_9LACO